MGRRAGISSLTQSDINKIIKVVRGLLGDDVRIFLPAGKLSDLLFLLVSMGPRRAEAILEEVRRSGAVRSNAVDALANVVAGAHDLAMRPPPRLAEVATYIIMGMDVWGNYRVRTARSERIWSVEERLVGQLQDLKSLVGGDEQLAEDIATAIAALVSAPAASEGGFLTVKVYDRLVKLRSPLSALRLAAERFWAFEPMAEDMLDRIAEGVKDAFMSAVGPGSVAVKRTPLGREIVVATTLSDLLGMRVPNDTQVTVALRMRASAVSAVSAEVTTSGRWAAGEQDFLDVGLDVYRNVEVPDEFDMSSLEGLVDVLRRQVAQAVSSAKGILRDKVVKAAVVAALYSAGYQYRRVYNEFAIKDDAVVRSVSTGFLGSDSPFDFAVDVEVKTRKLLGARGAEAVRRLMQLLEPQEFADAVGASGLIREVSFEDDTLRIKNHGVRVDASAQSYERVQELAVQYLRLIDEEVQAVQGFLAKAAGSQGGARDDLRELGLLAEMVLLHKDPKRSPLLNGLNYHDLRMALRKVGVSLDRLQLAGDEVADLVRRAKIRFEPDGTITINGRAIEDIVRNHALPQLPESALRRMVGDAYLAVFVTLFYDLERFNGDIVDEVMKGSRITAAHLAKAIAVNDEQKPIIEDTARISIIDRAEYVASSGLPVIITERMFKYADDEAAVMLIGLVDSDDKVLSILGSGDAVRGRLDRLVDVVLRRQEPYLSTRVALRYRREVFSGVGRPTDDEYWVDAGKYFAQLVGLNEDGTYTFLIYPKGDPEKVYGIAYRARNLDEALKEADRTIDREQWLLPLLLSAKLPKDTVSVDRWTNLHDYHYVTVTIKSGGAETELPYGPHARRLLLKLLARAPGASENEARGTGGASSEGAEELASA